MSKNTVTKEQVEKIINEAEIEIKTFFGKCTVVTVKLSNGFVIVESSACVDPANYDENLGAQICLERITNKIWELEGYKLQSKLSEQK
ncbi:Gp49 family protein [Bacillus thuringiensis]|uniref:Gp49 family protein n=1 Tax=Bacillus thuringiensis TaxID=1428 RepID=UPI002DB7686E|nr:Gp49 family protein [Bacillus thuringiensis]MEC3228211.1 Gp49 family protein [Bacillus thuringiensis]MEC3484751.1 Gp49 family protein [Bacillus thuringiensis]MED2071756.1 Gp49 family protein [Bacillus thuringiensis]MED2191735.1 Gp49 family protein [Bacillus thuringiensis]MED2213133.1 Gp49 family protein [Bacillus thuringiensis]